LIVVPLTVMKMVDSQQIREKFAGALLGAALGDAIGASREGLRMANEHEVELLDEGSHPLRYTDDTHMTIGMAESLVECGGFDGEHMARRFVDNYLEEPWRGYGPGPPRVFRLIQRGERWDRAAAHVYPGGSFGNGSAMRVSPVGLFYWSNAARLREAAQMSSIITHTHPLGMEGAALQATAVALVVAQDPAKPIDTPSFISRLLESTTVDVYRTKIAEFGTLLEHPNDRQGVVNQLGHGIEAFNSVPTAIFSFLSHSQSFASTVTYAVSLGGDTDTIASMAGAISGAYLGIDALPSEWQRRLENIEYIAELADRLWQAASAH
jgi:poly(ADP-ribose) glycohydrolase ARH3